MYDTISLSEGQGEQRRVTGLRATAKLRRRSGVRAQGYICGALFAMPGTWSVNVGTCLHMYFTANSGDWTQRVVGYALPRTFAPKLLPK